MAGTVDHSYPVGQSSRHCQGADVQVVHCTRAVGKGRMHSRQAAGLRGSIHQKRAPFTNSHTGPACSLAKERCLGVGSPLYLRGLPLLSFLESPSRTLLVTPGESECPTPDTLCLREQLEQTQPGESSEETGLCRKADLGRSTSRL